MNKIKLNCADAAAAACNELRAKVELAQRFAPLLEERGILDRTGKPCAKHVRVACPGVDEDRRKAPCRRNTCRNYRLARKEV